MRRESWWAPLAAPGTPFEHFSQAARSRNAEMRLNPVWQRLEKLQQIGQL